MSTVCVFADSVPFALSVWEASSAICTAVCGGGRSAVLAMLGIR